ncbi:hypothetical protein M413DRAFT_386661 [Hebeloma cylindrosporum]|uniref:Uncharacterized protein n=1 Tax=Hebeloma cylindrosporum TaxID=76867 RepID=A0A0C3C4B3_HEBCY|nr:hypothetical protein M413DRAFT_386661 [Hebeloma cylindrosporum h7]
MPGLMPAKPSIVKVLHHRYLSHLRGFAVAGERMQTNAHRQISGTRLKESHAIFLQRKNKSSPDQTSGLIY